METFVMKLIILECTFVEFKPWTRLFAFHIALISSEKVTIQLFSQQEWLNSMADWVFKPDMATSLEEGKLSNQTC